MLCCLRGRSALRRQAGDPIHPVETVQAHPHLVTDIHRLCGFRGLTVNANVSGTAGGGSLTASFRESHRPHPAVDTNAHSLSVPAKVRENERVHSVADTIAGPVETEIEVSRSRFLTRLERVENEAAAREVIASVRSQHPRARHHCSAFVLGPDQQTRRSNDDGEPSGTAGAPMLEALVTAELSDIVAVVTRYFGGVLLGAGGLTRAYRAAVAGAVAEAQRMRREFRVPLRVRASYELAPQLESEARRLGFQVGAAEYGADVQLQLLVPETQRESAAAMVREVSAGNATFSFGDPLVIDLVEKQ